jgi:hypothetical protein
LRAFPPAQPFSSSRQLWKPPGLGELVLATTRSRTVALGGVHLQLPVLGWDRNPFVLVGVVPIFDELFDELFGGPVVVELGEVWMTFTSLYEP